MNPDNELTEVISINEICRLCANQNDKLIGIYSEDGINNELAIKMNMYLPVKVNETDDLPLQCCWQCASTVLAWHELVVTSLEADRRLKDYQLATKKQDESTVDTNFDAVMLETNEGDDLNTFCQNDPKPATEANISTATVSTQFILSESENLEEYVHLGSQYLTINHQEYELKMDKLNKVEESEETDELKENLTIETQNNTEEEDTKGKLYNCQTCNLIINENELANHIMEVHKTDASKLEITVPTKEKKEKSRERRKNNKINYELVDAAKVIVDGKVYYNCKSCGRVLHSPYTFIWHMRIHTGERPHGCDICGKQFRVSQGLIRHLKETHEGIKNFACDICNRKFATKRNVEEHRRIHTNERPYVCDLCGKTFKQKASLFVHNRSHTDFFPFKCSFCNQMFRTKPPLLIHITKHTGEKPYPCEICGRHFRIKYELKRHLLIHSDEKPFSCNLCGLSFKQKRYLRNHNKLNHNIINICKSEIEQDHFEDDITDIISSEKTGAARDDSTEENSEDKLENTFKSQIFHRKEKIRRKKSEVPSPFLCLICNKCYTRKHDLQKHILLKHPDEKPTLEISARVKNAKILQKCKVNDIFKCDFCESKFKRSQLLLAHRRIHTQEKPQICDICGKQFASLSATKRHIEQVHHKIKKICCEFCDTRFDSNDKKREHMNIHTNDRPFMCALCGKSFRQRASLFAHKIHHSNDYPYDCRWCEKKFKRKSEIKFHEMTHTGEKKFPCDFCNKSFSMDRNLKRHILKHAKYSCKDCQISFGQKKLLKAHNDKNHCKIKNKVGD